MACSVLPSASAFPSAMLTFLDCQATTLGSAGYQALSAPGSGVMMFITTLVTILVALTGYRMLLGETSTLREGVLTLVRIGVVLAFATSWPAYRTVVYDVTLRAPAELASAVGSPAQIPGAAGGLPARLDGLDRSFRVLAIYGAGVPSREQVEQSGGVAPPLFGGFDSFAIGFARILFLAGSLGAFALVRLGAGLLLAMGPLFLGFLLFSGTRGLFEGWLRGLIALALASAASALIVGIELALFEPWLADLAARRASGQGIPNAAATLLAAGFIFSFVLAGILIMIARIAAGLRFPLTAVSYLPIPGRGANEPRLPGLTGPGSADSGEAMPRARQIADQIAAAQRREEGGPGNSRILSVTNLQNADSRRTEQTKPGTVSLGQSFRRRTRGRISNSMTARDRTA